MTERMKIAHIVNVTEIDESKYASYLHIAQPLTLKTMVIAARIAKPIVEVELFAIKHKSEHVTIPPEFRWAPDIEKYGWEYFEELNQLPRKKPLPRIKDIIEGLDSVSDADYFIYTNLDIGLNPDFYLAVHALINSGYDAFCINRRTLPTHYEGILLDERSAELVFRVGGEEHGGIDCFIFRKSSVPLLKLGNVFIGFPPIGQVLKTQIEANASHFTWVKDRSLTFHLGDDRVWDIKQSPYSTANYREAEGLYSGCFKDRKSKGTKSILARSFNKAQKLAGKLRTASAKARKK
jgi:hypothetical protein